MVASIYNSANNEFRFQKLTPSALQRARQFLEDSQADYRDRERELYEDDVTLVNEKQEVIVERIKRYKHIVDQLKIKYDNRCQFEGCGFTFLKATVVIPFRYGDRALMASMLKG